MHMVSRIFILLSFNMTYYLLIKAEYSVILSITDYVIYFVFEIHAGATSASPMG